MLPSTSFLTHVRDLAHDIQRLAGPLTQDSTLFIPDPASIVIEESAFPLPVKITQRLVNIGLPEAIAEDMSDAYLRSAQELRTKARDTLKRLLATVRQAHGRSSSSSEPEKERNLYRICSSTYIQQTKIWEDSTVEHAQKALTQSPSRLSATDTQVKSNAQRLPFNHVSPI
jgi:hypothetical protein